MLRHATEILACPKTGHALELGPETIEEHGEVRGGFLWDSAHQWTWPIRSFIPRFVEDDGYAASFGVQWHRYRHTQLDRWNGTTLSRDWLFKGTGWRPEELRGQRVLEVGCGAGRFTQVLLDAGADVYAVDASSAVEACWSNNGPHPRLHVIQADVYTMPFRHGVFDRVFCYGVLQHTPDVKQAFMSLVPFLKSGGHLAIDVYRKRQGLGRINRWGAKYWWRPLTRHIPPTRLARIVEWYVPRWLPVDSVLQRIPIIGRALIAVVPCWNYTGLLPLSVQQIREWAILDTFDALAAYYDSPQTVHEVQAWCHEADLTDIEVRAGGNGMIGNARKR